MCVQKGFETGGQLFPGWGHPLLNQGLGERSSGGKSTRCCVKGMG